MTRNVRLSALKGRPLARKVQGLSVAEALKVTDFSPCKAAFHLGKTLKSAVANLRNKNTESNVNVDELRVKEVTIMHGPTLKRVRPRAQGRAYRILKRMCHITVTVSD